jgi:hypothetical protein
MIFIIKNITKKLREKSQFANTLLFYISFIRKNKYIPSFDKPSTYNEKVNYRKKHIHNSLFAVCSDKVSVKYWIIEKGLSDIVIENYYIGESISVDILKGIIATRGDVLLKANHNSGPVYLLTGSCSDEKIKDACADVNNQLTIDYGKLKSEPWYSDIKPQILVEQRLQPEQGDQDLKDYKFHVFKQNDGTFEVILHIDFDRSTNHHRSFFDEELNWLPFSVEYPSIVTTIEKPKNYQKMLDIVKLLAGPFSYVRVDLYNIGGEIYFGELTFAHGSGCEKFSSRAYDMWLGKMWQEPICT